VSAEEEALRDGYAALTRCDFDGWLEGFDPDAELHELAESPDAAAYRGHDEIRRWATEARDLVTEWDWSPEEIDSAPSGALVVRVRLRAVGRGSDIPIEQQVWHVARFREGKIAVISGFLSEDAAREAAERAD
jgi:ketosteroid isomerase-like protein